MAQHYIINKELDNSNLNEESNKENLNTNNNSFFDIKSIINFIIDKYKQILLLLLAFLIIWVVDHITYYNNLFYSIPSVIPGASQPQIKPNILKKHQRKIKK
jgi:hypothetical protein